MSVSYSKIVSQVPAMTPFVGPETIERRLGAPFRIYHAKNVLENGTPEAVAAVEIGGKRLSECRCG